MAPSRFRAKAQFPENYPFVAERQGGDAHGSLAAD